MAESLDGADADVLARLRDHLQPLHVGDAVARVKDEYLRAAHVGKALKRRLAGIP